MRDYKEIQFSNATSEKVKQTLYNAYINRDRVKIKYKPGYEDFTGYHDKTGLIHFCYVGCSSGEKPILLEIYSSRSHGGPALMTSCIQEVTIIK